ncbi:MAG TPA: M1 family metallopeptidase [Longimicrobiales bacterium]
MRTAFVVLLLGVSAAALPAQQRPGYTRADTLRGSYTTPGRAWWDVAFYDLHVAVQPADSSIRGYNRITYRVLQPAAEMQIDLMTPLEVDSMVQDGRAVKFRRDGNVFFATLNEQPAGATKAITVYYHGRPRVAKRPPWDGGFTWAVDSLGKPWVATSNQGVGASIWWPNKDTQADEPDSQRVAITVPKSMIDVSNGRLRKTTSNQAGTTTYEWFVKNPINNYDVAVNAGGYTHYSDTFDGESGRLTLDFWPLAYHLSAARQQWTRDVKPMLKCFEHWFGPYPWYEDGYKLVEAPHLGMEHQSAVAYGNHFLNGYLGRDLSATGLGLKWDFIVVHESAHEWWGNNITTRDIADMWVHESFANYAEGLYTECLLGKDAGATYTIGTRLAIQNDAPIVGDYGVNSEGSGDMYYKGGNMLHTIRQIVGDDEKWRGILRGLNQTFRHQTVTGQQVQEYISQHAGIDLSKVFEQYLRTTQVPVFDYRIDGDTLWYRWTGVVPGFDMPVKVTLEPGATTAIRPTQRWQRIAVTVKPDDFRIDRNFYVAVMREATAAPL